MKKLSYDGFGINGTDEYRTRLATFTGPEGRMYGPLFAAAPELLEALENAIEMARFHLCIDNGSEEQTAEYMDMLAQGDAAIKKAKEGTL